jgi:hypothetical protein
MTKIAGSRSAHGSESGSINQRHGSPDPDPDPDPHQNVMDPQHWYFLKISFRRIPQCVKTRAGPLYHICSHKVRTNKEYHSVRPSSELRLSQPLSRQRVFPSPQKQGGGGTLACGWGLGGVPIPTRGIHCGTLYMYVLCVCSSP